MSTISVRSDDGIQNGSLSHNECDQTHLDYGLTFECCFTVNRNPFLYPLELLDDFRSGVASSQERKFSTLQGYGGHLIDSQWMLIHTKPRQEKRLAEEMRIQGVPHFLPATSCKSVTRGRSHFSWAPLFPGYLFLKGTAEQRLVALKTNRIVATHYVSDQESLSQQLWDLGDLIEKGVPLRIEERFVAGQNVRVKSGPLKDKCGVIIMRGGKTRIFILIAELLGGVSVEVEQHLLELY